MKSMTHFFLSALFGCLLVPLAPLKAAELPDKADQAIKASFPDAEIIKIGRERERGAWYYEVDLKDGDRRCSVEVSAEGVIGEIEGRVALSDLPEPLQKKVRERVGQGQLVRVERHERRGVARSGKFVALHQPRVSYDVKYYNAAGERRELQLVSNEVLELPESVKKLVAERFPKARIAEAEMEDDDGVLLYSLSLREGKEWFTVVASQQGDLVEYEVLIETKELPEAARQVLHKDKDWKAAESVRTVAWETFFQVVDGKLAALHDRTYMATLHRGKQIKEYRFDGRGRETSRTDWMDASDDDGDEDDKDDD